MSKKSVGFTANCHKKGYTSEKNALEEKAFILLNPVPDKNFEPRSAYRCPTCGYWHLTSMSQDKYARISENKSKRESLKNPSVDDIQSRMEYLEKAYRIKNRFKK